MLMSFLPWVVMPLIWVYNAGCTGLLPALPRALGAALSVTLI